MDSFGRCSMDVDRSLANTVSKLGNRMAHVTRCKRMIHAIVAKIYSKL
jgi:hypothetical protein